MLAAGYIAGGLFSVLVILIFALNAGGGIGSFIVLIVAAPLLLCCGRKTYLRHKKMLEGPSEAELTPGKSCDLAREGLLGMSMETITTNAYLLRKQHGNDAGSVAAQRAAAFRSDKDFKRCAEWLAILCEVERIDRWDEQRGRYKRSAEERAKESGFTQGAERN